MGIRARNLHPTSQLYGARGLRYMRVSDDFEEVYAAQQAFPALGGNVTLSGPGNFVANHGLTFEIITQNATTVTFEVAGIDHRGNVGSWRFSSAQAAVTPIIRQTPFAMRRIDRISFVDQTAAPGVSSLGVGVVFNPAFTFTGLFAGAAFSNGRIGIPAKLRASTDLLGVFNARNIGALRTAANWSQEFDTVTIAFATTPTDRELYISIDPSYDLL